MGRKLEEEVYGLFSRVPLSPEQTGHPALDSSFQGGREPVGRLKGPGVSDERLHDRTGTITGLGEPDGKPARLDHLGH